MRVLEGIYKVRRGYVRGDVIEGIYYRGLTTYQYHFLGGSLF